MSNTKLNSIFKRFVLLSFSEWLLLFFPFFSVLGPAYVNLLLIISSIYFIYFLVRFKPYSYLKLNWIYLYLIFFAYVICTSFFATNYIHALQNSFSQIRFLLFSLFIYLCIPNTKNFDLIIKTWLFFILFVAFDTLIQFYSGQDIFGKISGEPTRLSGPFGKELIVGAFISMMSVPLLSYYNEKINGFNFKFIIFSLIYIFLIITLALSGERLSFLIFVSSTLIILILKSNFKKILIFSFFLIFLLIIIYKNNYYVKNRVDDFNHIIKNFYESSYGRLYESSYLLFKKNYIFGVGLKNYRYDCDNQVDPRPNSIYQFCSTHPHNFYLEILTETGVIGSLLLLSSITTLLLYLYRKIVVLKKKHNPYLSLLYGNILLIFVYLFPIKTSGSFFTTWNGSFFWLNVGMALLLTKQNN
jgi:O-antigen ligase